MKQNITDNIKIDILTPIVDILVSDGFFINIKKKEKNVMNSKNQNNLKQQWLEALGPGWPCEITLLNNNKSMYYLSNFSKHNRPMFVKSLNEIGKEGAIFSDMRPLSTPLDFAPDWAEKIQFYSDGSFKFICHKRPADYDRYQDWPACPKNFLKALKTNTLAIPDDWRPK